MSLQENAPNWRKSAYCGASNTCVRVADLGDEVGVRDKRQSAEHQLGFTRPAFAKLIEEIRAGQHDLPA